MNMILTPKNNFNNSEILLLINGVTIQYKTDIHLVTATHRVSFHINRGDRLILLGPSGCGKSTLLKAVAGFIKPVEGEMRLNGRVIDRPGPDRTVVFQEFDQLLFWKTVFGNVIFPLIKTGVQRHEAAERAHAAIEKVGLSKFQDAYPYMLSGGMKQRVAIARAMAMEAEILLMDEPFAALDALTRHRMQEELLRLWDDIGFTMLFVTHSIEEAILLGTRIVLLTPHPGRVQEILDVRGFGQGDVGTAKFTSLHRHIHDALFCENAIGAHSDRKETEPCH